MPIRAERRHLYGPDWKAISLEVRETAGWRCQGTPQFPDCRAAQGEPHPVTGSKVVLTVAHLDHDETNHDRTNLRALCQKCHLTYDAKHHAANAARTRRSKMAQSDLVDVAEARP